MNYNLESVKSKETVESKKKNNETKKSEVPENFDDCFLKRAELEGGRDTKSPDEDDDFSDCFNNAKKETVESKNRNDEAKKSKASEYFDSCLLKRGELEGGKDTKSPDEDDFSSCVKKSKNEAVESKNRNDEAKKSKASEYFDSCLLKRGELEGRKETKSPDEVDFSSCVKKSKNEAVESKNRNEFSISELATLRNENLNALQETSDEQQLTDKMIHAKFEEVLSKDRNSDEYRQSLQEYNDLQIKKSGLDERITALTELREMLSRKTLEFRELKLQEGYEAVAASSVTLAEVDSLKNRYDAAYYEKNPNKSEVTSIRDENSRVISELYAKKDIISEAINAKWDEISEYVISNDLNESDTTKSIRDNRNNRYKQMTSEFNELKNIHHRLDYSITVLDENSRAISERLGEDYESPVRTFRAVESFEDADSDISKEHKYVIDTLSELEERLPDIYDREMVLAGSEVRKMRIPNAETSSAEIKGTWQDSVFYMDDDFVPKYKNGEKLTVGEIKQQLKETYGIEVDGIPYTDGVADFSGISVATISTKEIVMKSTGMSEVDYDNMKPLERTEKFSEVFAAKRRNANFELADRIVSENQFEIPGLAPGYTADDLKKWREGKFTWDEQVGGGYNLVPTIIHGNVSHTGLVGSSDKAASYFKQRKANGPAKYSWDENEAPISLSEIEKKYNTKESD